MNEEQLRSPQHGTIRTVLRIGGPALILVGLLFIAVGIGSLFSSFGTFEPPRYFWCGFVGIPLFALGSLMTKFGYVGDVVRYISAETTPVAKDTINYLGEGIQPGVKSVSKAIAEGIAEARTDDRDG